MSWFAELPFGRQPLPNPHLCAACDQVTIHSTQNPVMVKMTEINKSITVSSLVAKTTPAEKRADVSKVLQIFKKFTKDINVWGDGIIGAGKLMYQSKSQKPYIWFQCGVAPRKTSVSIYLGLNTKLTSEVVAKVGPTCSHGVGCLYFKTLADVNMKALELLIKKSFAVKEWRAPGAKAMSPAKGASAKAKAMKTMKTIQKRPASRK